MMPRLSTLAFACLLTVACKDGPTEPPENHGGPLTIVAGADATDTVMAKLTQGLIVEVRDARGALLPNAVVRFQAVPSTVPGRTFEPAILVAPATSAFYSSFASISADSRGRAVAVIRLGSVAGPAKVAVSVPELGLEDTAHYTVLPGSAARIAFTTRDTTVRSGVSYSLGASSADVFGNKRTGDSISFTAGPSVAAVDATGKVTAGEPGRGYVLAITGVAKDTARLSVVPNASIVVVSTRSGNPTIATMDLDGANYREIASVSGSEFYPTWDRQGTKILFQWSNTDGLHLHTVVPGSAPQRLIDASAGIAYDAYARYASDGSVFFTGRTTSAPSWAYNVFRARSNGTVDFIGPGTAGQDYSSYPDPSPDVARILYVAGTIKLLNLTSGQVTDLGANGSLPHFSPDGTRIAYISSSYSLMVMNADGSGQRQLTPQYSYYGSNAGFDWSPDGKWIIIRGGGTLELINVQSGQLLGLSYSGAMYQPAFHP